MTATPTIWLPQSAFTGPSSVEPIAQVLENWSNEWLADGQLTTPFAWQRASDPVTGRKPQDEPCLVTCTTDSAFLLAGALFCRKVGAQDVKTASDAALIRAVAQTAQNDLSQRINALFGDLRNAAETTLAPRYRLPLTLAA